MSNNLIDESDEAKTREEHDSCPRRTSSGRHSRHERLSQAELGRRYVKQETSSPGYKRAAVVILACLGWLFRYAETPHPPARVYVSHAAARYDAQGNVTGVDMTCTDRPNHEVPCDEATLAGETAYFQAAQDKERADAKAAAGKAAVKKNHVQ